VQRVLLQFRDAFIAVSRHATGMIASAWMDRVHSILTDQGLTKDARTLERLLREHGRRSMDEMKTVGVSVTITEEETEAAYASIASGSSDESLVRLAAEFLPRKSQVETSLQNLAAQAPLLSRISIVNVDEEGRKVASVGSVSSDPGGRLINEMSQEMRTAAPVLRAMLARAFSRIPIDVERMMAQVRQSPVFVENRYTLIEEGLRLFFAEQHIAAVHLLIPQIEHALRHLAELNGISRYRRNKEGGLDLRTLDDLLGRLTGVLGDDLTLYFRVLLSDRRGWNLRNVVCHGLLPSEAFGPSLSDRVFHVLLLLGIIRRAGESPSPTDQASKQLGYP